MRSPAADGLGPGKFTFAKLSRISCHEHHRTLFLVLNLRLGPDSTTLRLRKANDSRVRLVESVCAGRRTALGGPKPRTACSFQGSHPPADAKMLHCVFVISSRLESYDNLTSRQPKVNKDGLKQVSIVVSFASTSCTETIWTCSSARPRLQG